MRVRLFNRIRGEWRKTATLPIGVLVILLLAVLSSLFIGWYRIPDSAGLQMWTFARNHMLLYEPVAKQWNERQPGEDRDVTVRLLSSDALARRMLSGFMSGTPLPDLMEVLPQMAAQAFKGPLEAIGFADLTDRLRAEGLYERINEPSFSPWTSRGRIFGLPHDVHPVTLGYRADIIEAAGIDAESPQTWLEFVERLRPLVRDTDGDGDIDHYVLNYWETNFELTEVFLLQAGGGFFGPDGALTIDSEINAFVLATLTTWTTGPGRIAANAPEFDAVGNKMRLDGYVLCSLVPDWLTGVWREDLPGLSGRMKLRPLPTWTPGGNTTSVMGGTMLGLPKDGTHFEEAWGFAIKLYFSAELARGLYERSGIISPIRTHWTDPVYQQPSAYFSGQPVGRLFIAAAPFVPVRSSSPYNQLARNKAGDAHLALKAYASKNQCYTVEDLLPEARRLLAEAQALVQQQMERNLFLVEGGGA